MKIPPSGESVCNIIICIFAGAGAQNKSFLNLFRL